jgi:acyl-CoA thioester hydrolase
MNSPRPYTYTFKIPQSAIDENGHVNNVAFVQWMQDAAVNHYTSHGGVEALGGEATWVVREHRIEYLLPAFVNEEIEIQTWISEVRRIRSQRQYRFIRKADNHLLVRGATEWVYVDIKSGKPIPIPQEILNLMPIIPNSI